MTELAKLHVHSQLNSPTYLLRGVWVPQLISSLSLIWAKFWTSSKRVLMTWFSFLSAWGFEHGALSLQGKCSAAELQPLLSWHVSNIMFSEMIFTSVSEAFLKHAK